MSSNKRQLKNKKNTEPMKKRNTTNLSLNIESDSKILPDLKSLSQPKLCRQIGSQKWAYGHNILDMNKNIYL